MEDRTTKILLTLPVNYDCCYVVITLLVCGTQQLKTLLTSKLRVEGIMNSIPQVVLLIAKMDTAISKFRKDRRIC